MSPDTSPPPGSNGQRRSGFADAPVPESLTAGANRDLWWIRLVLGMVAFGVGVMVITWPEATVTVVAVLFGVNLLIDGCLHVVQAILTSSGSGAARALYGLLGALFIVIGVLCLRNLLQSLTVLVVLVGVSWLLAGIFELIITLSSGPPSTWNTRTALDLGTGAVALIAGVIVLVYPQLTLGALVILLGISLVVSGVVSVVNAFRQRAEPST
jgi:uncharacterized membrane protein HdeD (DUF308 family)